jgi:hypothetical protein
VAHHGIYATTRDAKKGLVVLLSADAHTFAAEDTTVGIVVDERVMPIHFYRPFDGGKRLWVQADFEESGDGLKLTGAVGVAVLAVNLMH